MDRAATVGAWKLVHEEKAWLSESHDDYDARCYQPQIYPKWISDDGKYDDVEVRNSIIIKGSTLPDLLKDAQEGTEPNTPLIFALLSVKG